MLQIHDRARDPQFDDNPGAAAPCPVHPDLYVDDGEECWWCAMDAPMPSDTILEEE